MNKKHIASPEEWLAARKELLQKEKDATRLLDELAAERQKLPWVKVAKEYTFDAADGPVTLRISSPGAAS